MQRNPMPAVATAGAAIIAIGSLLLSSTMAQMGLFPTLFLAAVIGSCIALQLAELSISQDPTG